MRLDKFIGHATDLSRAKIHILIKRGEVTVNGELANKGAQQICEQDQILLQGEAVLAATTRYLMLHKPLGYVCANSDSEHPTVLDLLELPNKQNLQIVGRLDIDTSGLVLITDDGQWNHRITSPKSQCAKVYRVTTADPIKEDLAERFASGILLQGEKKPSKPAVLKPLNIHTAQLTISEGKYHQVKRMFAATGNHVTALHRERIGAITLDAALEPGEYRHLTDCEISSIQ